MPPWFKSLSGIDDLHLRLRPAPVVVFLGQEDPPEDARHHAGDERAEEARPESIHPEAQAQVGGQRPRRPEHEPVDEQPQAPEGAEVRKEGDELQQQPQRRVQRPQDHRHDDQLQERSAMDPRHEEGRDEEADGGKEEAEKGVHRSKRPYLRQTKAPLEGD